MFAVPAALPDVLGTLWLTGTTVLLFVAFFWTRRDGRGPPLASLYLAFAAAAVVNLLGTVPFVLGLALTNRDQFLGWQLLRTLFAVVVILTCTGLYGEKPDALYLRKGRLFLGLGIGLGAFAFFYLTGPQGGLLVTGQTVSLPTEVSLSAWLLPFVLSNGLREELLFRGLFLNKYSSFVGPRTANLLQAMVFSLSHVGEVYTTSLVFFLVETFLLGLGLGYFMQRTRSLLGPALAHAGTDVPIVVVLLSNLATP